MANDFPICCTAEQPRLTPVVSTTWLPGQDPHNGRGLAGVKEWLWQAGETITFAVNNPVHAGTLLKVLQAWQPHLNLKLGIESWDRANVRIESHPNKGNWSAIGNGALSVPRPDPTANIADVSLFWVWLHEIGHALGFLHEHQSPKIDMQWLVEAVYAYYAQLGKNKDWVMGNLFWIYEQALATEGDPKSIMFYWLAPGLSAKFPQGTTLNTELSELDKAGARMLYPQESDAKKIKWLKRLYRQILEREADDNGLKYWLHQVSAEPFGVRQRGMVASDFLRARETVDKFTVYAYRSLLNREPNGQADFDWWHRVATEHPESSLQDVAVGILGSDEHWQLAQQE